MAYIPALLKGHASLAPPPAAQRSVLTMMIIRPIPTIFAINFRFVNNLAFDCLSLAVWLCIYIVLFLLQPHFGIL